MKPSKGIPDIPLPVFAGGDRQASQHADSAEQGETPVELLEPRGMQPCRRGRQGLDHCLADRIRDRIRQP